MWYLTGEPNYSHLVLESAFSNEEVERIKSYFENEELELGKVGNSVEESKRRSKIKWLQNHDGSSDWLYRKITDYMIEANNKFFQYDVHFIEPIQLSEYSVEYQGKYEKHVDYGYTELINRKLSFSIQLSDPSDYEGGDLILHAGFQSITSTRNKGAIVLFPSFMLHEVTEVTKGKRLSAVGWVSGPKFK